MARSIDLNLLPILVLIHDLGSVSAAAAQLGMSQSAVSMALARLRERYADPLFLRAGNGMQPTPRMRALVGPMREALARLDGTLRPETGFNPRTTRQTLTFAMTDLGEMVFMPKLLQRIRQLSPHVVVKSVAPDPKQIERGLEIGDIDLAVGYFPDLREKSFPQKHLFFHDFVCLLRGDHPIKSATLTHEQFRKLEHAIVYGAGRSYEMFERHLRAKKMYRHVSLHTPHFMSIAFVIAKSDLVVTVPHAVGVFAQRAHLNLRIAQPPMRTPRIDLKMHWHRNFQRDAKNLWLREIVSSLFTDELDEWRNWAPGRISPE